MKNEHYFALFPPCQDKKAFGQVFLRATAGCHVAPPSLTPFRLRRSQSVLLGFQTSFIYFFIFGLVEFPVPVPGEVKHGGASLPSPASLQQVCVRVCLCQPPPPNQLLLRSAALPTSPSRGPVQPDCGKAFRRSSQ